MSISPNMSISPFDLQSVDKADGILIQKGLHALGHYDGTFRGVPGPKTKAAYDRYRGGPVVEDFETGEMLAYSERVQEEFEFPGIIRKGATGLKARRVQEWLTYHDHRTGIDEDFGPATETALLRFQADRGLNLSGEVDEYTWTALVAPLLRAFARPVIDASLPLSNIVKTVALMHLREHPVELGGQNSGPWVRAYMEGNQGSPWPWCAGFVTLVMNQAAQVTGAGIPIYGSFSCDILATQGKTAGLFVSEAALDASSTDFSDAGLGSCCIFLVRRTATDWTHTGFAFDYSGSTFETIEGNTNDEGSREGFEVCRRTRGRSSKDFIRLA